MGKRRSPGDGTLYRRADGMWIGGIEMPPGPDGKRRIKRVSSKNRNIAAAKLRKLQGDMAAGLVPTAPSTTVGRWLDYWAADILPHRKVKPGTIYQYELTIRRYLAPAIGSLRLDKLTPADMRSLYVTLTEEVSGRAAQKAHQVMSLALEAAVRDGVLGYSVMDRVDKPAHTADEGQAFTAEQAMHIIRTAEQLQDPMWAARWALGFLTGARESEILGLQWTYVNLDKATVDISWQLQRLPKKHGCGNRLNGSYPCGMAKPSFCPDSAWRVPAWMEFKQIHKTLCLTRPKTKSGRRIIPLVPSLVNILRALQVQDGLNPHGLVFHYPDGRPIDQERDQRAWKQLLNEAGLPHTRQHSIRHSTATLLLEAGVDSHIVQAVIGHSDIATTRGYQHVNIELAKQAWAPLSALVTNEYE